MIELIYYFTYYLQQIDASTTKAKNANEKALNEHR